MTLRLTMVAPAVAFVAFRTGRTICCCVRDAAEVTDPAVVTFVGPTPTTPAATPAIVDAILDEELIVAVEFAVVAVTG